MFLVKNYLKNNFERGHRDELVKIIPPLSRGGIIFTILPESDEKFMPRSPACLQAVSGEGVNPTPGATKFNSNVRCYFLIAKI